MGLLFCCPECGANLRVTRSAAVATVACPGCSEPIRVPRTPHPAESAFDTPAVRAVDANRARAGLSRLKLSLTLFGTCTAIALAIITLRASASQRPPELTPSWVPITTTSLTTILVGLALLACWFRVRGYLQCRRAGADVGVEFWMRLAAAGAIFTGIGELSTAPWFMGMPLRSLPSEAAAFVLIGLLCGAIGIVMEFAFLSALHRLLWETSGWQAANKAGNYAITFVFAAVSAMATVIAGYMIVILSAGGTPGQMAPDPVGNPLAAEIRIVSIMVLAGLTTITALVCWRYARLLSLTRRALATPQAYAGQVASGQK
jgi:hypothetical protein